MRVASCLVNRANSFPENPGLERFIFFCNPEFLLIPSTDIGNSSLSLNSDRTCLSLFPSMDPLTSEPSVSTAIYSNAGIFFYLVFLSYSKYFINCCYSRENLPSPITPYTWKMLSSIFNYFSFASTIMD